MSPMLAIKPNTIFGLIYLYNLTWEQMKQSPLLWLQFPSPFFKKSWIIYFLNFWYKIWAGCWVLHNSWKKILVLRSTAISYIIGKLKMAKNIHLQMEKIKPFGFSGKLYLLALMMEIGKKINVEWEPFFTFTNGHFFPVQLLT